MVSTGAVVGIMVVLCFVLGMLCMFMRWSTITTREAVAPGLHQGGEFMGASAAGEAAAAAMGEASTSRGLDEGTVQSLPLYQLPRTATLLINPEPCPICLAAFLPGQFVRVLPSCYHTFHLPCIDQWFSSHSNCPLCRSLIISFPGPLP